VVSHGSFGRALRQHITGHAYTDRRVPREAVIPNGEIIRWPQGPG
jgi:broad specificity phosphatase PhoE